MAAAPGPRVGVGRARRVRGLDPAASARASLDPA